MSTFFILFGERSFAFQRNRIMVVHFDGAKANIWFKADGLLLDHKNGVKPNNWGYATVFEWGSVSVDFVQLFSLVLDAYNSLCIYGMGYKRQSPYGA